MKNMNILYLLWGYEHDKGIIKAFRKEGINISTFSIEKGRTEIGLFKEAICSKKIEIVFSINFHGWISDLCQAEGIPYCSWVLEFPNYDLYTRSIFHPCNYIALGDSFLVERLWSLGLKKVFYLPDAIESVEESISITFQREFCFVGNKPENTLKNLENSKYERGYLDAFIQCQRVLPGINILENGLINRVYQEIVEQNPIPQKILPEFHKLYIADKYMSAECTIWQQNIFLQNNANIFTIYSDSSFPMCDCKKYPYPKTEEERRQVYKNKEFSIVLASPNIHNAIPRQTLEIIAAGGFPICSFQRDYLYFFEKDHNLVYFTGTKDFFSALDKYGNDGKERKRIQEASYEMVKKHHTYTNRIVRMLEAWSEF